MKLKNVVIHKYKSIESDQGFEVNERVTVLVGMNESGKTAILESIAKTNYFQKDKNFKFNKTHDYPRKEKKRLDKSGDNPKIITCTYEIPEDLVSKINEDIGDKLFKQKTFLVSYHVNNLTTYNDIEIDKTDFLNKLSSEYKFSEQLRKKFLEAKSSDDVERMKADYKDEGRIAELEFLKKYFKNEWKWSNPVAEYVARVYLKPHIPKFLYYDEYYSLPSRISLEKLKSNDLNESELKTAKALIELADINIDELLKADDFEDYKAELEATEAIISDILFRYWETNKNLRIKFDIDKIEEHNSAGQRIVEHILDVRVNNNQKNVSLPLKNRSKGFNWFFSFLVWFQKIQEDKTSKYILLLDEPGLNLHAAAQSDLLKFLEDLSEDYQIIYSTHSPFMVSPNHLERVRTVLETNAGTKISDTLHEKDPNTLFPLQAAFGYEIHQTLFIGPNNLIVEGISDFLYLQTISEILKEKNMEGLDEKWTITPVGGANKVSTFVSLLWGQKKMRNATLLDFQKKDSQIFENLYKRKFMEKSSLLTFAQFTGKDEADIEDMFDENFYLKLVNEEYKKDLQKPIKLSDLCSSHPRILKRLENYFDSSTLKNNLKFSHYRPARYLLENISTLASDISKDTLEKFENAFKAANLILK